MNIKDLEAQIVYYATKYYEGQPEISDELFDLLVEELKSKKPDSSVLKTGWGFEVIDNKVKHKYSHIGSLDKAKSYEEIPNRFKNKTIYVSPKLDGLSAVAYYENGKLVMGVTRGNGNYGKNITEKLRMILGNEIIDTKFTGAVRGELIINNTNWQVLQGKYKDLISPRNFAAGIINRKDIDEDIAFIDMVVYKVVGQEKNISFHNRNDVLCWLALNFKHCIPNFYYPILNLASWDSYHRDTFEQFKKLGYGLDGLVLTQNDVTYDNMTNAYIYDEVAFKFPAESTTTTINDIEWELSRTQRLIPVAVVEPVELSGAIVERVTCNNARWVKDMEIGVGAEIEICRSNEVIPQILSVLQSVDVKLPDVCPSCGEQLVWEGVDLKCNNPICTNIKASDLQQWCENVGKTDGLQWTLMKQYIDYYGIHNINELYLKQDTVLNDLNSRKLSLTEMKIKDFFIKLYKSDVPVEDALVGLNIPRLGVKTAKLLSSCRDLIYILVLIGTMPYYKNVTDNIEWARAYLLELVKDATTESIMKNINKFKVLAYLYYDDYSKTRLIFADKKNDIKYVAVTGALETMKRKDFEKYIEKYGYELSSNISKCEYLITNNPDSGSSKNKKAKELGIQIITEKDFLNLL